jgi:hypothetical protein
LLDPSTQGVEIIDYKTGKYEVSPEDRSRQLLLYAKGFEHTRSEYQVKRLTFDMLEREKPLSFELDGNGEYKVIESRAKGLIYGKSMLWSRLPKILLMIMNMGLRKRVTLKAAKSVGLDCIVMVLVCKIN